MSEYLEISQGNKAEKYEVLLPQVKALLHAETDPIANMANTAAVLKATFCFLWVGFYRVVGSHLLLGPFQGPLACTRIPYGKGVCGSAWEMKKTIVVPDVEKFPGHIACSSESRAEIVVPVFNGGEVAGVLDIDSALPGTFDDTDAEWLEKIAALIKI